MTGKPEKRRLFSFDSTKASTTRRSSTDTSTSASGTPASKHARLPTLEQVDEFSDTVPPIPAAIFRRPASTGLKGGKTAVALAPQATNVTVNSEDPSIRSSSQSRWDNIRQHVLPTAYSRPGSPASFHTQQPSSASSSTTNFSQTTRQQQASKPSKLGRLGFKQVVEHARDAVADETQRLASDIQRACWNARYGEVQSKSRPEQVYHQPAGSALYLPFMSSHSLATTAMSSQHELRNKESQQTLQGASRPSIMLLYQTLYQHSAHGTTTSSLPHEAEVLATLIGPFLSSASDDERYYAVEAFELVRKTWVPDDELTGVRRCLWCIDAASLIPPSPSRTRLISLLWNLTVPPESASSTSSPRSLRTLIQGIYMLLAESIRIQATEDARVVSDLLERVKQCGNEKQLDSMTVEEEFNALFVDSDSIQSVREAVALEALMECVEHSSPSIRRLLLRDCVQIAWTISPFEEISYTPLMAAVIIQRLRTFCRAAISISVDGDEDDAALVSGLIDTRVIPEIEGLGSNANVVPIRQEVAKAVLQTLTIEGSGRMAHWSASLITHWYHDSREWIKAVEEALKTLVITAGWPQILKIFAAISQGLPNDVRKVVLMFALPLLNDRLVETPPPSPFLPLTALLDSVSQLYPQILYKPLFQCAASTKDFAVINYLCIITMIASYLSNFWTRDAEMVAIALMSGGPDDKAGTRTGDSAIYWAPARLGQSVLFVELIGQIQALRRVKEEVLQPDSMFVSAVKFAVSLEARLNVFLEAKERVALIPPSQRLLLMVLFREIRLLTKSLRPAPWLSRGLNWLIGYHTDDDIYDYTEDEVSEAVDQIQAIYDAAEQGGKPSHQRRSTMVLSPKPDRVFEDEQETNADLASLIAKKKVVLPALKKGFAPRTLKLLVALFALLSTADLSKLGAIIWENYLESTDASTLTSACFLVMQCAERTPRDLLARIEIDLQSSSEATRLSSVKKLGTLVTWRFQVMSQMVITDRAHRPFKLTKGPLPFVATDMGTTNYVPVIDPNEMKDNLPLELRKRLAEMGWADDDAPVDRVQEWLRTPITILPSHYLDRLDMAGDLPPSPIPSPSPSPSKRSPAEEKSQEDLNLLLRRNSSSGGPMFGAKRKAVFVASLAQVFPRLALLISDQSLAVSASARSVVMDLMRNDPALLTRPIFDLFAGETKDMTAAITSLRTFLHIRRLLPPALSHAIWNTLSGFLKYLAKQPEIEHPLQEYALVLPTLAQFVNQVSDLSIRELRRAKIETFLIPSGHLWFTDLVPAVPMFPRHLGRVNPFDDLPDRLISITMIRVSQNLLLLSLLKRNPQDVNLVRKNMGRLVLPSLDPIPDSPPIELRDFVPRKHSHEPQLKTLEGKIQGLSLMLSRSYIPLVAQVFRCMSRHLNDRNELAILVEGVNRILIAHGKDMSIVSHALIAFMVASTRFRRLFASSGAYTLFMPALIKVYTESEHHSGIRLAIQYATSRFFAHHQETFVFQSLDVMSHVMIHPDTDGDWVAKSIYSLFSILNHAHSAATPDPAGIHDINRLEERKALMVTTAEEKPQTFLASLRKGGPQKKRVAVDQPQQYEYERKRLSLDDFVRLFFTIVAHDFTTARAEHFMKFLLLMTPHLYHASRTARQVLGEGIDALCISLSKLSSRPRANDPSTRTAGKEEASIPKTSEEVENLLSDLADNSRKPGNILAMQIDYLSTVCAFMRAGGETSTIAARRILELVKTILRDPTANADTAITSFLSDFSRLALLQDSQKPVKTIIQFLSVLAPILSSYASTLDISGALTAITGLCSNSSYSDDPGFAQFIVTQVCAPLLSSCQTAASDKLLLTLPCRLPLVSLLVEAVFLREADILSEIEKCHPSYEFLAGVLLPFALSMKKNRQTEPLGNSQPWHRRAQEYAWARMLAYAISAGQNVVRNANSQERRKSSDSRLRSSSGKLYIPAFSMALQVVKVVIIRGERNLSNCLPDVWNRLALFTKSMLFEGNADFAVRQQQEWSPLPSPTHSPRGSLQLDSPITASFTVPNLRSPAIGPSRSFACPRVVDYCLWSVMELLCLYRTPLLLHLRPLMQETLVRLSNELRHQHRRSTADRRISSVFSKPRRISSHYEPPSPKSTPQLSSSQSLAPYEFSSTSLPSVDSSGYQILGPYQSNSPQQPSRIVHLGLVPNQLSLSAPPSPGGAEDIQRILRSSKIRSMMLIKATYRRIRTVQACMGYQSQLLPLPNDAAPAGEDLSLEAWSLKAALQSVVDESVQLMEEFEEAFAGDTSFIDGDLTLDS